ncbi:MAG TPA: DMT family transporter [Jiangellaceae bacterium]|nr:DMT family transporter [Jiangellaceae bacterium]
MSRRGWVLFLVMGVIWGIPYLLIKVAVEELSPAALVLARTLLAAALLMPIAAVKGQLRPLLRYWRPLLAYTVIEICVPWLLIGYAEQDLSSSLTGMLIAAVPLVGAVLVRATGHEPLDSRRVAGLVVGFAGVAALVGFDVGAARVAPVVALGVVAFCYAAGPLILARYLSDLPGLGVVAVSLAVSALIFLPVGAAQWPAGPVSTQAWLSVFALAVVCTAIAFLVFFRLIAEVGPARATVITYLNPAVALVLGVLVLDESVSVATLVGFGLILAGCVLATARDRGPRIEPGQRATEVDARCLSNPVPEP